MTPAPSISLLRFLLNPRGGMPRLNGWQRIWLVITGFMFALHVVIGFALFPALSTLRFDPHDYEDKIAKADKWKVENRVRCTSAIEELQLAHRINDQNNEKIEAQLGQMRAATQAKIDEAKVRLFAIETSGGKFYGEWVKYDNAVEAYQKKLSEQRWSPRAFNEDEMVKPGTSTTIKRCALIQEQRDAASSDLEDKKRSSEYAIESAKNFVLVTLISFLFFTFGLYLFGWCIGWIRGGFKS